MDHSKHHARLFRDTRNGVEETGSCAAEDPGSFKTPHGVSRDSRVPDDERQRGQS